MVQVVFFRERPAEWDFTFNNPQGMVGTWLYEGALAIVAAARRQVGVRTGNLRQSIHVMKRSRLGNIGHSLEVGSNVKYALMHHEGTPPHKIEAGLNQFLRFSVRGRAVITRTVQHPGTRANRYLKDNLHLIYTAPRARRF